MTGVDAPAPYRTSFDNARDPYTARNALGITPAAIGAASTADFPATAWTAWSPTITSGSGTITTSTVNTARYTKMGKTILAFVSVTINNQGTGAGFLSVTLPVTALASLPAGISGREIATTGVAVTGNLASTTTVALTKYDGTTLVITNYVVRAMVTYESA